MQQIKENSIDGAIAHCKKKHANNPHILYRGEAGLWPLRTTLARKTDDTERNIAEQNLHAFSNFLESTEELRAYKKEIDAVFAVAQHYGMPTHYLDFTIDINVALYFATHNEKLKPDTTCCLIYFDRRDFIKETREFKEWDMIATEKDKYPEIVDIDVANLWRLQAQKGKFIYTPVTNMDDHYNCFTKLVFPFSSPYDKITEEEIYPNTRSSLEIQINQFFDNRKKANAIRNFEKNIGDLGITPFEIFSDHKELSIHPSWSNVSTIKIDEAWEKVKSDSDLIISLKSKYNIEAIRKEVALKLKQVNRAKNYNWVIQSKTLAHPDRISIWLKTLWEGVRNQPYTDEQIQESLAYILYLSLKTDSRDMYEYKMVKWSEMLKTPENKVFITVEMRHKNRSSTKFPVSAKELKGCLRNDIFDFFDKDISISDILIKNNKPHQIFDRKKLEDYFIKKMLPVQILSNDNKVNFFSLNDIEILGRA